MVGVITGLFSLYLHLFWKFRTANTTKARWKALRALKFLPGKNYPQKKRLRGTRPKLKLISGRNLPKPSPTRHYQRRSSKRYQREAA